MERVEEQLVCGLCQGSGKKKEMILLREEDCSCQKKKVEPLLFISTEVMGTPDVAH